MDNHEQSAPNAIELAPTPPPPAVTSPGLAFERLKAAHEELAQLTLDLVRDYNQQQARIEELEKTIERTRMLLNDYAGKTEVGFTRLRTRQDELIRAIAPRLNRPRFSLVAWFRVHVSRPFGRWLVRLGSGIDQDPH